MTNWHLAINQLQPRSLDSGLWSSDIQTPTQSHTLSQSSVPTTSAAALSLLTSLGGIVGYARTGSVPSIAAGLSVGALYLYSFLQLQNGQPYGAEIGLLASAVLGGSSVPRAIKKGKPVPVGLSLLATYGLVVFGLAFREKRAARV
ncbi:TMEM14 family protein [Aspergillus clavatus NRRL 1]|uniref:Transmembrane 14C domain protein n=1 Tax=Aspergillus clavatus (strain ATCC 1007 / CBS 513.65 / DSM 816 / NCTC 3887 / NRRL 1 / QM 1276 / 107) TaxID=344612 RepID=A1CRT5_ASPCL|nr:transmembrane 14C domain protein [Aspergillus clavatus NRRL 1]EAW08356.1 transmembrane 14C domain protein [Aspergillus clavatus NRRL 1]